MNMKLYTEHGYLRGNKRIIIASSPPIPSPHISEQSMNGDKLDKSLIMTSSRRTLMDVIIETVSKCAEELDDNVHIQVYIIMLFLY